MPLYRYECQQCHERTEILQRVNDAPRTECPTCGGELTKLISAPAIQFKGSGFYKTDYASTAPAVPSKSGKSESGESSKSESAGSSTDAGGTTAASPSTTS